MRTDLPAQIAAMIDEYRATRARIAELEVVAADITTTVRAPDRSVTVTVDAHGGLRDLRIDRTMASRLDSTVLAERILGAARLAAAQAREQVRVRTRDVLPERLRDLVRPDGSVDLAALLPDVGDPEAGPR